MVQMNENYIGLISYMRYTKRTKFNLYSDKCLLFQKAAVHKYLEKDCDYNSFSTSDYGTTSMHYNMYAHKQSSPHGFVHFDFVKKGELESNI